MKNTKILSIGLVTGFITLPIVSTSCFGTSKEAFKEKKSTYFQSLNSEYYQLEQQKHENNIIWTNKQIEHLNKRLHWTKKEWIPKLNLNISQIYDVQIFGIILHRIYEYFESIGENSYDWWISKENPNFNKILGLTKELAQTCNSFHFLNELKLWDTNSIRMNWINANLINNYFYFINAQLDLVLGIVQAEIQENSSSEGAANYSKNPITNKKVSFNNLYLNKFKIYFPFLINISYKNVYYEFNIENRYDESDYIKNEYDVPLIWIDKFWSDSNYSNSYQKFRWVYYKFLSKISNLIYVKDNYDNDKIIKQIIFTAKSTINKIK
ncbi:hypothetical protein [Mycoplasma hafezii]|uniref:hypothetical protein n=1 Tax=Mycoplasma hafezii TaxID=525886 RepID=UPI003CFAD603